MKIAFTPISILLITLIAQGVFAALLMVYKKENKRANRYLSLLIFSLSLWLGDAFFRASGLYQANPNLYFLPIYFSFGFGPLLYWYTRTLTDREFTFTARQGIHLFPVLFQLLCYVFLSSQDYSFRRWFWLEVHRPYTYDLELAVGFIILLLYLIMGIKELRKYRRQIDNNFSNLERITLSWLRRIYLALSGLAFFWLLESVSRLLFNYYPATPFSALTIGFTILFLAAGGILQRDLQEITNQFSPITSDPAVVNPPEPISPAVLEGIQRAMEEQELFLQQELSLSDFAQALGTPAREVSRTINQGLGVSFVDFVNSYRVEKFKYLIKEGKLPHLSLFGLALESGFNAKSTFNRVFKKLTGESPSDYQKRVQNAK